MLRARLATAVVAIPTLLFIILYPSPWPLTALVGILGALGVHEYSALAFPKQRGERALTTALGTLLVAAALCPAERILPAALAVTIAGGLVWTLFARPDFDRGVRDLGLALLGILYVGFLLPHFAWLHGVGPDGPRWVIFVIAVGMVGDSSGYFVGHAIGRHKLVPRISPGKTIEGSLGIVGGSLLAGAVSKELYLPEISWGTVLTLSGIMAVLGQLGDLCESIIKRTFGVKESGVLFPGHGGILDRIDSLLFPAAFLYYHLALAT